MRINNTKHVLSLITIAFFIFLAIGSGDNNDNATDGNSSNTNKFLAYNYAEEFVKDNLKSPSTAKFPDTTEKMNHITELGENEYQINSWVDSQNSFGAMIRSNFSCKIIFDGDKVSVKNLQIK